MTDLLKISNVSKAFREDSKNILALSGVNFNVKGSELLAVIGPSGCGKSTLLKIIAGLMKADSGFVRLRNRTILEPSKKMSMVFQHFALFPWLTALENVKFGLKMHGASERTQNEIARRWLREVGLRGFESEHPKELSGGMKQRVGLARALATDAEVLLMDEPFSALDAFTAHALRQDLLKIWKKSGKTIILVTHLVEEAVELADRIIVLTQRPGRVAAVINNNLKRPRNRRSHEFFKLVDRVTRAIKL